MTGHVRHDRDGAILQIVIDRPEKKNALTDAMYAELTLGLEVAAASSDIRAALLTSVGADFSAGNDIADFIAVASGTADYAGAHVHRFLAALAAFPKPLVVAARGQAVGIGATMLLHCDYVVLGESARLSTPFASLGLVPEAASSLLLPLRIGHPRAFAMLALGEVVDAAVALAWGLANRVVPDDRVHASAASVAAELAMRPPAAVQETKRLMRDGAAIAAAMAREAESFRTALQSAEARAAFTAFTRRRKG